jgi:hypothetical protein
LKILKRGTEFKKKIFGAKRGQSGKSHHAEAATDDEDELKILTKKKRNLTKAPQDTPGIADWIHLKHLNLTGVKRRPGTDSGFSGNDDYSKT